MYKDILKYSNNITEFERFFKTESKYKRYYEQYKQSEDVLYDINERYIPYNGKKKSKGEFEKYEHIFKNASGYEEDKRKYYIYLKSYCQWITD